MKIAVASTDGARVAASFATARCVLVFQVMENDVQLLALRPNRALAEQSAEGDRTEGDRTEGDRTEGDDLPPSLVRQLLDCQFLVAGTFTAPQEREFRRLGLFVLAALPGEKAESAVRFVVSGTPPRAGSSCGPCPNPHPLHLVALDSPLGDRGDA